MSQIEVRKNFAALAPQAVRLKAQEMAEKLAAEYNLEWKWESQTIIDFVGKRFPSKGVTGKLAVEGQNVKLTVFLPFMLAPLGGKIEAEARAILDNIEAGR